MLDITPAQHSCGYSGWVDPGEPLPPNPE